MTKRVKLTEAQRRLLVALSEGAKIVSSLDAWFCVLPNGIVFKVRRSLVSSLALAKEIQPVFEGSRSVYRITPAGRDAITKGG